MNRLWLCVSALTGVCLFVSACFFIADKPRRADVTKVKKISAPTKAHLRDGSVVICPKGFAVRDNYLFPVQGHGQYTDSFGRLHEIPGSSGGFQFDLANSVFVIVDSLALDSIAFLEYYTGYTEPTMFFIGLAQWGPGSVAVGKYLFGSCPTIHTVDGESERLEAECFSYSIAPQLEGDDLDRLDYGRPENGKYTVTLANEAFETHYINELHLIAVDHVAGAEPFPTPKEDVVLFGEAAPLLAAHSFSGRDVKDQLQARDDVFFESDSAAIAALANGGSMEDGIELEVAVPDGAQRMVVAFKLRATLMNTIFFYEMLLGSQGFGALEWMQPGPLKLFKMWRLHRWYADHFGLRVQTFDGNRFKDSACIVNAGPIAWRHVAVEIPAANGPTARLRIASLAGNWAIDWVGVCVDPPREVKISELNATDVRREDGAPDVHAAQKLLRSDEDYLVTFPGDAYRLTFELPPPAEGKLRSYFVRSRGYYIEWLRQSWLTHAQSDSGEPAFEMGDDVLRRTAAKWLARRTDFERSFFASRLTIPKGER